MGFLREPTHVLLLVVVLAVLFGSSRLPGVATGLGQAMRIFKAEMKEMRKDEATPAAPRRAPAESAEPLEGRVVGPTVQRATRVDGETPRNL